MVGRERGFGKSKTMVSQDVTIDGAEKGNHNLETCQERRVRRKKESSRLLSCRHDRDARNERRVEVSEHVFGLASTGGKNYMKERKIKERGRIRQVLEANRRGEKDG